MATNRRDQMKLQNKKILMTTSLRTGILIGLGVFCAAANAGHTPTIPEPGILSLLGIGSAVGLVMYIRNKRDK